MIQRSAVRALLLADPDRLLLTRIRIPARDTDLWIAPGGGLEDGEEPVEGLIREVREETGLTLTNWSGPVWRRRHVFELNGATYDQREEFYLIRTAAFDPDHSGNPADAERELFRGFRWWTLAEIQTSSEVFVPREMGRHLESLVRSGSPEAPVDVGT